MAFSGPFASEIASGTTRQAGFRRNSPPPLGVADDSSLTRASAKIVRFFSTERSHVPTVPPLSPQQWNGIFYLENATTGKQTSLRTKSGSVATQRLPSMFDSRRLTTALLPFLRFEMEPEAILI
jgi:hypothetical protein